MTLFLPDCFTWPYEEEDMEITEGHSWKAGSFKECILMLE